MAKLMLGTREVTPAIFTSGGGGIGIPREVKNGVYQMSTSSFPFSLPSNVVDIDDHALSYAFYRCTGLTSVDLSSLTTISNSSALTYAFYGCTGLTSVDLSSLTTISGNSGIKGIFFCCTGLTNISFPVLSTISGTSSLTNALAGCTSLSNIYFNSLKTTSFGSNVTPFNKMMSSTGNTKTHTIHFPSNLESTIQGLTGYPLFGGTDGYVVLAFDLPATS